MCLEVRIWSECKAAGPARYNSFNYPGREPRLIHHHDHPPLVARPCLARSLDQSFPRHLWLHCTARARHVLKVSSITSDPATRVSATATAAISVAESGRASITFEGCGIRSALVPVIVTATTLRSDRPCSLPNSRHQCRAVRELTTGR